MRGRAVVWRQEYMQDDSPAGLTDGGEAVEGDRTGKERTEDGVWGFPASGQTAERQCRIEAESPDSRPDCWGSSPSTTS